MSLEELAKHDIQSYRSSEPVQPAHTHDHLTVKVDTPEQDQMISDHKEDDDTDARADDDTHTQPSPIERETVTKDKTKEQMTVKNETSVMKDEKPGDRNRGQEGDANMEKREETTEEPRYRWGRDCILSLLFE